MRICTNQYWNCSVPVIAVFQILFLFVFFLSPTISHAQTPFQKGFGNSLQNDRGFGLDQDGSDYAIAGSTREQGGDTKILVTKVNTAGTFSGETAISESASASALEWGFDIQTTSANSYVIAGAHQDGNGLTTPQLTTLSGTSAASSIYPNGMLNGAFNGVAVMQSGNVCGAGYTENQLTSGGDLDGLLVIANGSNLSLFAGNSFGGVGDDVFHDVIVLSNGNLMAVGSSTSYGAEGKGIYVLVADPVGAKVWSRLLDGPGDDIAYAVVEDSFGVVIVGQTNSYNMAGRTDPCMARYQLNGQFLSLNVYENTNYQDGARGVDYVPGDGYILSGRSMGADSIAWMMRISPFFQPTWYQQYDGTALYDVKQIGGGSSFLAVGSHLAPGNTRKDLYVVHADAMGNTGSTCSPTSIVPTSAVQLPMSTITPDTVLTRSGGMSLTAAPSAVSMSSYDACTFVSISDAVSGQLVVYPNPGNGQYKVRLDLEGVEEVQINIADLQGRSVHAGMTLSTSQSEAQLDLQDLPAGIYLMQVRAGAETWTRKLIKE